MTPTLVPCRTGLLTAAALLALACSSSPTGSTPVVPPPPPPTALGSVDGVWAFMRTVTEATGACTGVIGQRSSDRITLAQGGVAAPYEVNGRSVDNTTYRGSLTSAGALHMTGSVYAGKGVTPASYDLSREGSDRMVGIGGMAYIDEGGCWVIFEVVATRGLSQ